MLRWTPKAPDEVLDYGYVWQPRLGRTDAIVSAEAVVVTGSIRIEAKGVMTVYPYPADQAVTVRLAGGVEGEDCAVALTITTADGERLTDTVAIAIRAR